MIQGRYGWRKLSFLLESAKNQTNPLMTEAQRHDKNQKPIVALDLGAKFVGVAVSDERHITISRLPPVKRSNWKRLLSEVENLIESFDAQALVLGLPLRLDGDMGSSAMEIESAGSMPAARSSRSRETVSLVIRVMEVRRPRPA